MNLNVAACAVELEVAGLLWLQGPGEVEFNISFSGASVKVDVIAHFRVEFWHLQAGVCHVHKIHVGAVIFPEGSIRNVTLGIPHLRFDVQCHRIEALPRRWAICEILSWLDAA